MVRESVRESLDLLGIMLIVAVEFIMVGVGITSGPVNILFGVLLALVLPGYALSAAAFRMRSVRSAERAALTLGLSLSVAVLGGLVLDASPAGFQTQTWLLLLGGVTVGAAVIAFWRRNRHAAAMRILEPQPIALPSSALPLPEAPQEPLPEAPQEPLPEAPRLGFNRETIIYSVQVLRQFFRRMPYRPVLIGGLAVVLVMTAIAISVHGAQTQEASAAVTQLWMLPDKTTPSKLHLGIHTEMAQPTEYRLTLTLNGVVYTTWKSIRLRATDTWETTFTMPSPARGDIELIEADLYRADQPNTIFRHVSVTLNGSGGP